MEDCYFIYRTRFHSPEISREEQVRFVSKGIDYRFEIKLNDKVIWSQEGMFTPVDIDITGEIQDENTLEIKIWPVPKKEGAEQDNRIQASDSVKPAVSYGWDLASEAYSIGDLGRNLFGNKSQNHLGRYSYRISTLR